MSTLQEVKGSNHVVLDHLLSDHDRFGSFSDHFCFYSDHIRIILVKVRIGSNHSILGSNHFEHFVSDHVGSFGSLYLF